MKTNLIRAMSLNTVMLSLFCFSTNLLFAQGVEILDDETNILLKVEDEGSAGSIFLNSGIPPTLTTYYKLYNVNGILNWNGNPLGSPLWLQNSSDIYFNTGKVGIGITTPTANLHVVGIDGALFTGTLNSGAIPIEGAGVRMMWYPKKAAFRAGTVIGTEWDDANIGNRSIAIGDRTTASGGSSTAMGVKTISSGSGSTAMGFETTASGNYSTAMGWGTIASGGTSTAIGHGIQVSGNSSMAIALNDQTGTNVTQAYTMAIMGGKVGIGTVSPSANLHVTGIDGALFTGTYNNGTIPVEGAGTRMMWYPKKAAFRVGIATGTEWDDANIGEYSIGMGYHTTASGDYSTAFGKNTSAIALYSTAFGSGTTASGGISTAFGSGTTASGDYSTAFGHETLASGEYSTAMGRVTTASGYVSTAMGYVTTASGDYSTAMGYVTTASGDYSTAMGRGIEASGVSTIAIALNDQSSVNVTQANTMAIMGGLVGIGTIAPLRKFEVHDNINSYVSLFKNSENDIGDGIRITLQPLNPDSDNRYADFMRNGGASYAGWICGDGIGGVVFSTTSDSRLKMNIEDYEGALEMVSKIKVKQYEMKSAPGKEQIGFLAQELMEIYPQAVSGDPNGNVDEEPMGVDYGRITPLLVKAIQEQQEMIAVLQAEIELLKKEAVSKVN